MIDLGLSEEYLTGFNARCNGLPFDESKSDDWKMGWQNANNSMKY